MRVTIRAIDTREYVHGTATAVIALHFACHRTSARALSKPRFVEGNEVQCQAVEWKLSAFPDLTELATTFISGNPGKTKMRFCLSSLLLPPLSSLPPPLPPWLAPPPYV